MSLNRREKRDVKKEKTEDLVYVKGSEDFVEMFKKLVKERDRLVDKFYPQKPLIACVKEAMSIVTGKKDVEAFKRKLPPKLYTALRDNKKFRFEEFKVKIEMGNRVSTTGIREFSSLDELREKTKEDPNYIRIISAKPNFVLEGKNVSGRDLNDLKGIYKKKQESKKQLEKLEKRYRTEASKARDKRINVRGMYATGELDIQGETVIKKTKEKTTISTGEARIKKNRTYEGNIEKYELLQKSAEMRSIPIEKPVRHLTNAQVERAAAKELNKAVRAANKRNKEAKKKFKDMSFESNPYHDSDSDPEFALPHVKGHEGWKQHLSDGVQSIRDVIGTSIEDFMVFVKDAFEELVHGSNVVTIAVKELLNKHADLIKLVLSTLGMCVIVPKLKSQPMALSAVCLMYLEINFDAAKIATEYMWIVKNRLQDLCGHLFSKVTQFRDMQQESVTNFISEASDWLTRFIDGGLATSIRNLIIAVAGFQLLPKDAAKGIWKALGKVKETSFLDLIKLSISSVVKVIKVVGMMANGTPLSEALLSEDPYTDVMKEVDAHLQFADCTYVGLPRVGFMHRSVWIKKGDQLYQQLQTFLRNMSPKAPRYLEMNSRSVKLLKALTDLRMSEAAVMRRTPLGIILEGMPQIGKGELLKLIHKIYCDVIGVEYSADLVYSRSLTSDYLEGYDPFTNPIIHYAELGSIKSTIAARTPEKRTLEMTAYMDSNKQVVDMAFEGKGKVFMLAELFTGDTNTPLFNLKHMVNNWAAYARRFLFVRPRVKKQWATAGGAIDKDKIRSHKGDALDIYELDLIAYMPLSATTAEEVYLIKNANIYDFTRGLFFICADHISAEMTLRERVERELQTDTYRHGPGSDQTFFGEKLRELGCVNISKYFPDPEDSTDEQKLSVQIEYLYAHYNSNPRELLRLQIALEEERVTKRIIEERYQEVVDHFRNTGPVNFDPFENKYLDNLFSHPKWKTYLTEFVRLHRNLVVIDTLSDGKEMDGVLDSILAHKEQQSSGGSWLDRLYDHISPELRERRAEEKNKEFASRYVRKFDINGDEINNPHHLRNIEIMGYNPVKATFNLTKCKYEKFFWHFLLLLVPQSSDIWHQPAAYITICWFFFFLFSDLPKLSCILVIFFWLPLLLASRTEARVFIKHKKALAIEKIRYMEARLKGYYEGEPDVMIKNHVAHRVIVGCGAFVASTYLIIRILTYVLRFATSKDKGKKADRRTPRPQRDNMVPEKSTFILPSDANEPLNDIEEKSDCSISLERLPTKSSGSTFYDNYRIKNADVVYTGRYEDFRQLLENNAYTIHVECNGLFRGSAKILGIYKNYAITVAHLFSRTDDNFQIDLDRFEDGKRVHTFRNTLTQQDIHRIREDLCIIKVSQNFKDIRKHFIDNLDNMPDRGSGYFGPLQTRYEKGSDIARARSQGNVTLYHLWYEYYNPDHRNGDCGRPLVANIGKGHVVLGIHALGELNTDSAGVIPVCQEDFELPKEYVQESLMELHSRGEFQFRLESPIPKSAVYYENLQNLHYYGKVADKPVVLPKKSQLVHTIYAGTIEEQMFDTYEYIPEKKFGKPLFTAVNRKGEYLNPYNVALKAMAVHKKSLDRVRLRKVIDMLTTHYVDGLKKVSVQSWKPLDMEIAINAIESDYYLRRIDLSKSAGFGFEGKKKHYFELVDAEKHKFEAKDELKARVLKMLEEYAAGRTVCVIFEGHLKDEPRSMDKIAKGATRMFFASPLEYLIVCKMYLSNFYTSLIQHGYIFGSAIGIDMWSEGHDLYNQLVREGYLLIEGDWKGFDTSMPFDIAWASCSIIYNLHRAMGYNEFALKIVQGILTDSLITHICVCGDIFMIPGIQPSGKYDTASDNTVKHDVMLLYLWLSHSPLANENYFENFLRKLFGDDLLARIRIKVADHFNSKVISELAMEHYGMTFTDSSKSLDVQPFVESDKMSFLKRYWTYNSKLNEYVAALDKNSVIKTLEWMIPSSSTSVEEQVAGMATSAIRELFLWSNVDQFHAMRNYLTDVYKKSFDLNLLLPTYEELLENYREKRLNLMSVRGVEHSPVREYVQESGKNEPDMKECLSEWEHLFFDPEEFHSTSASFGRDSGGNLQWPDVKLQILIHEREVLQAELKEAEDVLSGIAHPAPGLTVRDLKKCKAYNKDMNFREAADKYLIAWSRVESILTSISLISAAIERKRSRNFREMKQESEVGVQQSGTIDTVTEEKHETVMDVGGNATTFEKFGDVNISQIFSDAPVHLNETFARPVEIFASAIPMDVNTKYVINPWDLYFADPTVRSRLRNYSLIRADLNLRVQLFGTHFHKMQLGVTYVPWADYNTYSYKNLTDFAAGELVALTYLTSFKNHFRMQASDNTPVDFKAPFIAPYPAARLYNQSTSGVSAGSSFIDITPLGKLALFTMHPPEAVSDDSTQVDVVVYAWLTNVQLGCPTGNVIDVAQQSGPDEREIGPIEAFATRSKEVSDALTLVPSIAPYAKASSMAMGAMKYFASIFGWSVPTVITRPHRIKNEPFQNDTQVIGNDTGKRITMDPKQELTIDPKVFGTNEDEMSIAFIAQIPSFVYKYEWLNEDETYEAMFTVPVTPSLSTYKSYSGGQYHVQPSNLAFAAQPFVYWRGILKFRFEIIVSKFHRGKIGIWYEPNIRQRTLVSSDLRLNKQYVAMIDIQETQEFEFCIDWAQHRHWLQVPSQSVAVDSAVTPANLAPWSNGCLIIAPIGKLQSPKNISATIMVYVSAEEIQFNEIDSVKLPARQYIQESGIDERVPSCMLLNPTNSSNAGISELHFGEQPVSFRSYLKRFATTDRKSVTLAATDTYMYSGHPVIPSYTPFPSDTTPVLAKDRNLFSYLRGAYIGMRGGLRKRIRYASLGFNPTDKVLITTYSPLVTVSESAFGSTDYTRMNLHGCASYVPVTNGGVEFEVPMYTQDLYWLAGNKPISPAPFSEFVQLAYTAEAEFFPQSTTFARGIIEDTAVGEDFMFGGYMAPPFLTTTVTP